ncbi:hypothetical protein GcC1_145007 [Golovinomyces cichoracearum]|uniref:Uncharacterized protein n=1 Tax=Golovinomyces cichoracearum TaxID=62708 RepID=A0A420HZ00_9PEZI|nr:hypothetical protein GcC1_145007 [Golovinomyces cichoracearum]
MNTVKTAEGEEVTTKGKLFKSSSFAQKARKTFEKYKKNKRDRAHLVEHELADDSSQDSISPVNRIEGEHDDIASLLEAIDSQGAHLVEVDAGMNNSPPPLRDKPDCEGIGEPHNIFLAELLTKKKFTVFFYYGCVSCYVFESLSKSLPSYISTEATTMIGVGGVGPRIIRDVLLTGRFISTTGKSNVFRVSCAIVPDHTFPGDLTLGKGIFHKWGIMCTGDTRKSEEESITLVNFTGKPTLKPIGNSATKTISQHCNFGQFVADTSHEPISRDAN